MTAKEVNDQYLMFHRNRRLIYAFLSKVYEREVTVEFLEEISSKDSPIFLATASHDLGEGEVKEGFAMLSKYLEGLDKGNLDEAKLRLAVEYANIFLGVKGKPAHPSESAYMSEEHLVMQKARDDVLAEYRKAGVDKVKEFTEPEDHIALELQFMGYLCRRTVEALEKGAKDEAKSLLETQKSFVNNHLARWVPQLTNDILETARVDFYKGIAKITDGFIKIEQSEIGDLIAEM